VLPRLATVHVSLCERIGIAEELLPLNNLSRFFGIHEKHAQLPLLYTDAQVIKDTVPRFAVDAYQKTFRGESLPLTAHASLSAAGKGSYERAVMVATEDKYIVFPKASADACLVAAYALLQCQETFLRISWEGSLLKPVQTTWAPMYDLNDFHFWVTYGSWSFCRACGSHFFNDKYFSEVVYQNQVTSQKPDLLAAYRRAVPDDPVRHEPGQVGISSRWWNLPGMYTPVVSNCHCCSGPESPAEKLKRRMAETVRGPVVNRTNELYRIPIVTKTGRGSTFC